MSGARRTEDFNTVKTRQLILVNPNGSFPARDQLIGVVDSRGGLGPIPNPVFNTITADSINVAHYPYYQDISAITIQADTITTNTLDVINNGRLTVYDLCANRVETTYLTVTDVSAECIHVDTIFAQQIGSAESPVVVGNFIQVNAMDFVATETITTPYLYVTTQLEAQDISANYIDAETITAVDIAMNTISRAESINTIALTAGTADISGLIVRNIANIRNLISTDISAANIIAENATVTGTLSTSGVFNPASINTTGTITANSIRVNDISATSIYAATASFGSLNVTSANVDISGYYYKNLTAGKFTSINSISAAGTLDVSGATTLRGTTASSLSVSGLTTMNTIFATQITAPIINAGSTLNVGTSGGTSQITLVDTNQPLGSMPTNPGVLTYDVSNGLLLNGNLVSTTAAFGQTQPFSLVTVTNNLATVADISATMFDLINSYNAFLTIFSNAKLIIKLTPVVVFSTPCSIQFDISGVRTSPLILYGQYTLGATNSGTTTLMTILTQAALNVIQFTATPDVNNIWSVRINVPRGTRNYITDATGMPTGSLQVLRTLGFNVPIASNPFEIYELSGSTYVRTAFDLSGGYVNTGSPVQSLIQYNKNLPDISYNVFPDPYSLPITFVNISDSRVLYLAIQYNGVYTLYSKTNPTKIFGGLTPNTGYPLIFNYLDLSNNTSANPILMTTRIPAPKDISSNAVTFNSFTVTWSQPYPGHTYSFIIDASGNYITGGTTSNTTTTFFPLLQESRYYVTLTSYESAFDTYSNPAPVIIVNTPRLIVPTPVISVVQNSNITARVSWSTPVPSGVSGEFDYYVRGGALRSYYLPGSATSFTITDLSGTGDISGSLLYTDNAYNTNRGSRSNTYYYDTSFGYYDMVATNVPSSIITLDNTTLFGIGFVLPNLLQSEQNPWVGYTFNKISFPQGITESTGNSVTFRATVYSVPAVTFSGLYEPTYSISPFDLNSYATDISSSSFVLDASATRFPTLSFSRPVVYTTSTLVLLQILSGSGRIKFRTFLNTDISNRSKAKIAYATSVAYQTTGSGTLTNFSNTSNNAVICQFSYV